MELLVIDVGSMSLLMTALTCTFTGTLVWPLVGEMDTTVAGFVSGFVPVSNVELKQLPLLPAISV